MILTILVYIRRILQRPHAIWMDNYCRFLPRRQPLLDKPMYENSMWTCQGALVLDDPTNSIDKLTIASCLPPRFDDPALFAHVRDTLQDSLDMPTRCFNNSISKGITTVPIRNPQHSQMKLFGMLPPRPIYIPMNLFDVNISSNVGLSNILADYKEPDAGSNWRLFLCDTNIFKRTLKVTYIYSSCYITSFQFLIFTI